MFIKSLVVMRSWVGPVRVSFVFTPLLTSNVDNGRIFDAREAKRQIGIPTAIFLIVNRIIGTGIFARERKRYRLEGEGEEDWRAAPVVFARRPQDSVDNTERDGDAPVEGPASGVGDVRIQAGRGGGHASAEGGRQLDLPEKPSSIELTRGYGAVMGIAFGAGAFALRHWT